MSGDSHSTSVEAGSGAYIMRISISRLCALAVLSLFPCCIHSQIKPSSGSVRETVYVWQFQSNLKDPDLVNSVTEEFETALEDTGRYKLVERRSLARLLKRRANETTDLSSLGKDDSAKLKAKGAQGVVFGNIFNDIASGSVRLTVTLELFDGSIEWKKSVRMRPPELRDDEKREEKYKELLGVSMAKNRNYEPSAPVLPVHSGVDSKAKTSASSGGGSTSPSPVATVSEMAFDVSLQKCAKQNGGKVECIFTVTNRAADRPLTIFATTTNRGSTLCVDADGAQLTATSVSLGSFPNNRDVRTTAFSNVAIRGSVVFPSVDPNGNSLAVLSLRFNAKSPTSGAFPRDFSIEFHNVPLDVE